MQKVSGMQVVMLTALIILVVGLKHPPVVMMEAAREGAWVGYIAGVLITGPIIWMLYRLSKRFPNEDLFLVLIKRAPLAGRVIVLAYLAYFLFMLAHDIRFIIGLTNILLLPTTPIEVTGLAVALAAYYAARDGIEAVARLAQLFFPVLAVLVLSLPLMLGTQADIRNIDPLEWNVTGQLKSALYAFGGLSEIIVLPFIAPYPAFRLRSAYYGLALGTLLLGILLIESLLVFGPELASLFFDPPYMLIRQIRITDFLDRLDLPILAVWMLNVFVKISLYIYAVSLAVHRLANIASARIVTGPVGLSGLVCSYWFFESSNQLVELAKFRPFLMLVYAVLLPLLLFVWLRAKAKRSVMRLRRN
ncbi:GerAB/ArcD/ProY family transporter [Paenibacillus sambharensis]|nr:endospore germination permease [Paenibacillus sambharensis]